MKKHLVFLSSGQSLYSHILAVHIVYIIVSQAVSGLDIPKPDMKNVETKKLPEAIDNMFLVARRIQARFAQIPKRPVSYLSEIVLDIIYLCNSLM